MSHKQPKPSKDCSTAFFVRTLRRCLNKTQGEFGKLIGKSEAIVRKWEAGAPVPETDVMLMSLMAWLLSESKPFNHVEWFEALAIETMKPDFNMANVNALAAEFKNKKAG